MSYGHDNQGGIYTGTSFSDKTFYGFKLDSTGDCQVEVIRSDDSDTVVLPQWSEQLAVFDSAADSLNVIMQPDDYRAYFWSVDAVTFRFNSNTGHLEMVVF
tara:strand:+ start:772 stop:1074 length:303 start_codon:yes stop_codon:yes gene_type:complete